MRLATVSLALLSVLAAAASMLPFPASAQRGPATPGRSATHLLQADQVRYTRIPAAGFTNVDAEWIEPDGARRTLNFRLPALSDPQRALVPPSGARQQEAALAAAQAEAGHAPHGVTLRVVPRGGGISVEAGGPSGMDLQTPINRVMEAYRSAGDRAVADAGFLLSAPGRIEPDYRRLLGEQASLLRTTGQDIARATAGMPQRARVALLLGFVQSLPYMTLRARDGAALRTPAGVLAEDRGDCDEKSLTLATLLSLTDPDLSSALLLGETHAFLAVSLAPEPGDVAGRIGGRTYVMLEPVGPGWFPVGRISGMSLGILGRPSTKAVVLSDG